LGISEIENDDFLAMCAIAQHTSLVFGQTAASLSVRARFPLGNGR